MTPESPDLLVVGAGPAGMAAASSAHACGLSVLLVDNQPHAGGQAYRGAAHGPLSRTPLFGAQYRAAAGTIAALEDSPVRRWSSASVIHIDASLSTVIEREGAIRVVRPRTIVVASGAQERPVPVPGWTLPGVMTVGAAQIAFKSSGLVADDAVFVGSGPLLHLVVAQYLAAGARIRAVLDTTPRENLARAAARLPLAALTAPGDLLEGMRWLRLPRRAGVPIRKGIRSVRILGRQTVEGIEATSAKGDRLHFETRHVFLHDGIVPSIDLPLGAGCACRWSVRQQCWQIVRDARTGETSVRGLYIAGDAGIIAGAGAAAADGTLAGLAAARRLGKGQDPGNAAIERRARRKLARAAPLRRFLDACYASLGATAEPIPDDAVACRCEAVTFARLRAAIAASPRSLDAVKSLCRIGMGPCQGRLCAATLHAEAARTWGTPLGEISGPPRIRFPVRPVTLGALADALDRDLAR